MCAVGPRFRPSDGRIWTDKDRMAFRVEGLNNRNYLKCNATDTYKIQLNFAFFASALGLMALCQASEIPIAVKIVNMR